MKGRIKALLDGREGAVKKRHRPHRFRVRAALAREASERRRQDSAIEQWIKEAMFAEEVRRHGPQLVLACQVLDEYLALFGGTV